MSIVVGYDFGTDEVPTRETLLRQAKYLRVRGIGLSSIDATLLGLRTGTSGTTGATLPAPGWMWGDPEGSLWVETDHGPVQLHRAGGGWESVRYRVNVGDSEGTDHWKPGYAAKPVPESAQAAQTDADSEAIWAFNFSNSNNGAGIEHVMVAADTVPTTASYARLVGRGVVIAPLRTAGMDADHTTRFVSVGRVFSSDNAWFFAFANGASNTVSGATKEQWFCTSIAPHSGTSNVAGEHFDSIMAWKFDQQVSGPGAGL